MARILVSYYRSDEMSAKTTLCFFDSFCRELEACGNSVLAINNAYFGIFDPSTTTNKVIENHIMDKAKAFDPELIIAFNHRVLRQILDEFDVPVVIYDGDELRFFSDLDYIKDNIDRYKVFSIVKEWRQDYLDFGFNENQVFYMPSGTSIKRNERIAQTKNISFLGQRRFFLSTKMRQAIVKEQDLDLLYDMYLDFLKTGSYDYEALFKKDVGRFSGLRMNDADLWPLFDNSYLIFAAVLDLGLHLGGHEGKWSEIVDFIPQIAITHDHARVFNLKENQDYYNSSVISLCPMHPQAKGMGFSWRCFDIMASNACLVASQSSELKEATKDYVDLPMFDTPQQAREICERLLKDESERKEIVQASQRYVDDCCRWPLRFREMEDILGMPLLLADSAHVDVASEDYDYIKLGTAPISSARPPAKKKTIKSQVKKVYKFFTAPKTMVFITGVLAVNAFLYLAYMLNQSSMPEFLGQAAGAITVFLASVAEVAIVFVLLYLVVLNCKKVYKKYFSKTSKDHFLQMSRRYTIVFPPQGLGDILYFGMYAKQFKALHPKKKLAIIVTKPHFKALIDLFPDAFDKVIYEKGLRDSGFAGVTYLFSKIYDKNNPQKSIYDAIVQALGVDVNTGRDVPAVDLRASDAERFAALGAVAGKTVLISPDATSCADIMADDQWEKVGDKLSKAGYTVFFNTNDAMRFGDYPTAFFDVADTVRFCDFGGYFLGYRSGLCDVVAALSTCRQFYLYPNNKKMNDHIGIVGYEADPNGSYLQYCSLKYINPGKDICEYVYKGSELDRQLEDVLRNWSESAD